MTTASGSGRPRELERRAVPLGPAFATVLVVASLAGLMMLCWPLLVQVPADGEDGSTRPSSSCCSCPW